MFLATRPVEPMHRHHTPLALTLVLGSLAAVPAQAAVLMTEAFTYAPGALAGNNGGSGWSGAWTGPNSSGSTVVTGPLAGTTGNAVLIADNASTVSRSLATSHTTGTTSYFLSFVFNAAPFQSGGQGAYAGVSLFGSGSGSGSILVGMPGSSGQLGFDWTNEGDGLDPAPNNTNLLVLLALTPGSGSGYTLVTYYATTDLHISASALVAGAPFSSTIQGSDFTFSTVEISGGYASGTIQLAGLALATSAEEALGATQTAVLGVPDQSSLWTVALPAIACAGWRVRRQRRRLPASAAS